MGCEGADPDWLAGLSDRELEARVRGSATDVGGELGGSSESLFVESASRLHEVLAPTLSSAILRSNNANLMPRFKPAGFNMTSPVVVRGSLLPADNPTGSQRGLQLTLVV